MAMPGRNLDHPSGLDAVDVLVVGSSRSAFSRSF